MEVLVKVSKMLSKTIQDICLIWYGPSLEYWLWLDPIKYLGLVPRVGQRSISRMMLMFTVCG